MGLATCGRNPVHVRFGLTLGWLCKLTGFVYLTWVMPVTFPAPFLLWAACVFEVCIGLAACFQLALAAGAPWGHLAMGGQFPGVLPPAYRWAVAVQAAMLVGMGWIVWRSAMGLHATRPARGWMWGVVLYCVVAAVLNLATPSVPERRLWGPITVLMTLSSLCVAVNGGKGQAA